MSKPIQLRERDRSPKPVRSPSPDYVAKSVIISTKSPNSAEIAEIARLSSPKIQIPLIEEITHLRKENQELRQRVNAIMGKEKGTSGAEISGLLQQLKDKDEEIQQLRQTVSRTRQQSSRTNHNQNHSQNASLTPSKKISLIRTESLQQPPSTIRQRPSRPFAQDLQEPTPPRNSIDSDRQYAFKIRSLEQANEDLRRENMRLAEEMSRVNRSLFDLKVAGGSVGGGSGVAGSPEKMQGGGVGGVGGVGGGGGSWIGGATMAGSGIMVGGGGGDQDRALALVQKTKFDLERNLEDLRIRMSNRIHELQQRILSISKKMAELTNRKHLSDSRQRYTQPPSKPQDMRYSYPTQRPTKPQLPTVTSPQYFTKVNQQLTNQLSQLSQQLIKQQSSASQLRRQLESKESEVVRLGEMNQRLKEDIQRLQVRREDQDEGMQTPASPTRDPNIQKMLRMERENTQLKNQINTISGFLEQVKAEKVQKDIEVTNLNKTLVELRTQAGRVDPHWNQQDILRLQSDNKMLRDTLQSLRTSHSDLLTQLQKARKQPSSSSTNLFPSTTIPTTETQRLKQLLQLKSEVGRLKALNEILMRDKKELLAGSHVSQNSQIERTEKRREVEGEEMNRETERKEGTQQQTDQRYQGQGQQQQQQQGYQGYSPERSQYGTGGEFRIDRRDSQKDFIKTPERIEYGTGGEFRITPESVDYGTGGEFRVDRRESGMGTSLSGFAQRRDFSGEYEYSPERRETGTGGEFRIDRKESEKTFPSALERKQSEKRDLSLPIRQPERTSPTGPSQPPQIHHPQRKDTPIPTPLPIFQKQQFQRQRKQLLARFQQQKKSLSKDLSICTQDLNRQKQKTTLLTKQQQSLKLTLEKLNNELSQLQNLKQQLRTTTETSKKDIERYKRFAEENSLDLNILRKEKEGLEGQLREMEELRRRNEELKMEVRHREEEIVDLRRPRRSAEFDAILRELNELRYELDRVSFDPIMLQLHGKSQRLKTLLTDKSTQIRLMQKSQTQLQSLHRQNSTLKKQLLDLNSKYLGQREQNQRSKATLQSLQLEKQIFQREITRLREIINEYVNSRKDQVTHLEPSELQQEDTERQVRVFEEEVYRWESNEKKVVQEVDTMKGEFKSAIMKIDEISDRIVRELAQPR